MCRKESSLCIIIFLIVFFAMGNAQPTQVSISANDKSRLAIESRKKVSKKSFKDKVSDSLLDDKTLTVLYKLYKLPCNKKSIFSITDCFGHMWSDLYKSGKKGYEPLSLRETPKLQSSFIEEAGIRPLLHGIDFNLALDEHWSLFERKNMPFGPDINSKYRSYLITCVKAAYERYGSIPVFAYHMANPYSPVAPERVGAYQNYVDTVHLEVVNEMRYGSGSACGYRKEFLTPREYLDSKLDALADILKQLTDKNGYPIPCIIRPFHEMDMNSFWWGGSYCSPEDYKWLFCYTRKRIEDKVGTHNILWGYSLGNRFLTRQAMLEKYPGDEYVDIIGSNEYNTGSIEKITNESFIRCQLVTQYCIEHNKVSCMFESGVTKVEGLLDNDFYPLHYPSLVFHDGVYLSFFIEHGPSYAIPETKKGKRALRKFARNIRIKKRW